MKDIILKKILLSVLTLKNLWKITLKKQKLIASKTLKDLKIKLPYMEKWRGQ